MLGHGGLDERAALLGAGGVDPDGDELDPERVELSAQCLPHGQVPGAASIMRPGVEQDLLPVQAGEPELVSVQVGQAQVRRLRTCERA